jgi:hypothetical protein
MEKWRHGDTKSNVDRSRPRDGRELFYANLKENKKKEKEKESKNKKRFSQASFNLRTSQLSNCPTVQ